MSSESVQGSEPLSLIEWREALSTARHFNELLIRLRAIALPVLVAAAGVASSVDLAVTFRQVPVWLPLVVALGTGGAATALVVWAFASRGSTDSSDLATAAPHGAEWTLYGLFAAWPLLAGAAASARWLSAKGNVSRVDMSVAVPLVYLALVIVVSVYVLDRHYYYRLLVGAVNRAGVLEQQLGFKLTESISRQTPHTSARVITSALYAGPIAAALAGLSAFLWIVADG